MALTKQITHAGEFLEDGQIQVKEITRIMENGRLAARVAFKAAQKV